MSESTIKFTTQADLNGLQKLVEGLTRTKDVLSQVQGAAGGLHIGGPGGVGGPANTNAASGAAPPAPGGPAQGHGSAPPPPPVITATGPVPAHHVPGTAPAQPAHGAAPPPPPAMPTFTPGMMQVAAHRATQPSQLAEAPPPPPPPASAGGGVGATGGGGRAGPSRMHRAGLRGKSMMMQAAGTATALGLGASATGFVLASGQKYLELSKVITQLGQKFRTAEGHVSSYGATLGHTIAQTAGLAEAMGEQTNVMDKSAFHRQLGFARFAGADASRTVRSLGSVERIMGQDPEGKQKRLSDSDLAETMGTAMSKNMSQGRMDEFLSTTSQIVQQMFQQTGEGNITGALGQQRMLTDIFGAGDERGKGASGQQFLGGMNQMMTQKGPMQTFMMRAMGFGQEDSDLSYVDMRKRLEAGVTDSDNILDLFGSMQKRGLSEGGMFRALEGVGGAESLGAHGLEKLIQAFNTPEELEAFRSKSKAGRAEFVSALVGSLEGGDEAALGGGFAAMGKRHVSAGEHQSVQLEGMMMKVGRPVATAMMDMTDTIVNLTGMMQNLVGLDLGTLLTDATGAIKDLSETANKISSGIHPGAGGLMNTIRGAQRVAEVAEKAVNFQVETFETDAMGRPIMTGQGN